MTLLTRDALDRLARLARIDLSEGDAARLGPALEAVAREFGTLSEYAAGLAAARDEPTGALRADVVDPASAGTVEGIVRASKHFDAKTRCYHVPKERR